MSAPITQKKRQAGRGSIEEHPAGSGLARFRMRIHGRLVSLACGIPLGLAEAARFEQFPNGRQVYFMRNGLLVKIGWSDDVAARQRHFEATIGTQLQLEATLPGGPALERCLHAAFGDLRERGEWFHFTGALARLVDRVRSINAASGTTRGGRVLPPVAERVRQDRAPSREHLPNGPEAAVSPGGA